MDDCIVIVANANVSGEYDILFLIPYGVVYFRKLVSGKYPNSYNNNTYYSHGHGIIDLRVNITRHDGLIELVMLI